METINIHNLHNQGLVAYIQRYPRSGAARYFLNQYKVHEEWEDEEPTSIKIHQVSQAYGGPEEGGWWYSTGEAQSTHFIFSKKGCIKRCIELIDTYNLTNQPSIETSQGNFAYELTLGTGYAKNYPTERPHYE